MGLREIIEEGEQIDREELLEQLEQKNQELNLMREIKPEETQNSGELEGVPFVAKDAICTSG
ncbi:MAG: hypothetical protein ABEJ93_04110, partial [Candidatus Nanohalobium sp.]